jgi:hypothetical protein
MEDIPPASASNIHDTITVPKHLRDELDDILQSFCEKDDMKLMGFLLSKTWRDMQTARLKKIKKEFEMSK